MNPSVISSPPLPVEPVLLFDGECNLCHRLVRFLMWADRHGRLRFATVQSSTGQEMLRSLAMPTDRFDSVVLLASGRHWLRSAAFFQALRWLDWPFCWLSVARFLPRRLGDAFYDGVARNRYQWFGRNDGQDLPGSEQPWRYLPGGRDRPR
ncbi:TPA: thiol-disulfide oxidoreductase DCC family protein [Serratia odorifera]